MNIKRLSALLICLCVLSVSLFSASSGLVVRSPLFGEEKVVSTALPLPVSAYGEQLGLLSMGEEQQTTNKETESEAQRVLSAISTQDYPVTPGDAFQISYTTGSTRITMELQVESDYRLVIPGVENIDATGMTLQSLKDKVISLITTYYSFSSPVLTLMGTGSFSVPVIGEVSRKETYPCWGLTRLSSVVSLATPYASTRSVTVTGKDGTSKSYDLYRALRNGVLSEDPLLKPGDVVTLGKADKIVTLSGALRRNGTFQLLPGEGLETLFSTYGGGLLPGADSQHIRIRRFSEGAWKTMYVNLLDASTVPSLLPMDQIMVDSVSESAESMTIEGAVRSNEADDPNTSTSLLGQSSGKLFYQFYPGETLDAMLQTVSSRFMTVSDLEHAYLVRDGKRTPIDLSLVLSGNARSGIVLEKNDSLVIPFTQRFVTVTGAVTRSGVYAYVPDKPMEYYLALAGGPTAAASNPIKVTVKDKAGNMLESSAIIPEESTINVKQNNFVSSLAPTVAVIGLVSSIASLVLTIYETVYYANR